VIYLPVARALSDGRLTKAPALRQDHGHSRERFDLYRKTITVLGEGDLYAVKELLGHSSTRVTEVYLHSSRTRTASAVEALAAYRRSNRQTEDV
jgi:site-specific recombinase XerC